MCANRGDITDKSAHRRAGGVTARRNSRTRTARRSAPTYVEIGRKLSVHRRSDGTATLGTSSLSGAHSQTCKYGTYDGFRGWGFVFSTLSWPSSSATKPQPPHFGRCCSSSVPFSTTPSPLQSGQVFMCAPHRDATTPPRLYLLVLR
jgi:hypothetical protein